MPKYAQVCLMVILSLLLATPAMSQSRTIVVNSTPVGATIWYSYNAGVWTDSTMVTPHTFTNPPEGIWQAKLVKAGYHEELLQAQTLNSGGSIILNARLQEVLPKSVWDGQVNVRGGLYSATLYKIQSTLGVRSSGIDKTLALLIRAHNPTGAVLVDVVGGRNGWIGQSFTAITGVRGTMNTRRYLDAGTHVVFAEYRGSVTPGDNTLFAPPLPSYGSIIPGYDTDIGPEWRHGEVEDVVAILNFVKVGGIGGIDASRFYLAGGSHGGYLVLAAAHRVGYITKVFSEHGPTNGAGMADWFRNTPASAYTNSQGNSPRSTLDAVTIGNNTAEGNIWSGDREAFLQRVFRSAGGESEFINISPGCTLFTQPPLSTNILIATNVDDFIVPATQGRAYYRRWHAAYPSIKFVEHAGADVAIPLDLYTLHGDVLDMRMGDQFFDFGTVPAQYDGQVPASVKAKVIDSTNGNPISGATVKVAEQNVACTSPEEASGLTNSSGMVAVASVPSGFIRATVSAPGYTSRTYDFEISRGANDFTGTPVPLVPQ